MLHLSEHLPRLQVTRGMIEAKQVHAQLPSNEFADLRSVNCAKTTPSDADDLL